MKVACLLSFLLLMPAVQPLAAQTSIIRLACRYSYLVDELGDRIPTGGNYLLTVYYFKDGEAVIKKEDVGAQFIGTMTSEEIRGKTEYEVEGAAVKEQIAVDRFKGTFWVKSDHGLMFVGTCHPAEQGQRP